MHESHTDCDCYRKDSKCGIAYCSALATWQVEIQGFKKQYMCDRHTELLGKAVHTDYWYGRELLSK